MLVDGRPEAIFALYAFLVAAVIAWTLVPVAEMIARKIGAIDVPNERSLHTEPTPKLGGLAILMGILVSAILFMPMGQETRGILIGAATIAGVGVLDDVFTLGAAPKMLGQVLAASIAVFNGVRLTAFTLPFVGGVDPSSVDLVTLPLVGEVDLGELLAIVGIVAAINVINFIDGVDGLAAGVCVISAAHARDHRASRSTGRPPACWRRSRPAGRWASCATASRPPRALWATPAPTCSGYMLAVIAIQGSLKTNAVVALFFPLIILAVPILDTGFVVAKRIKYRPADLQGRPLALPPPDGEHRVLAAPHPRLPLRLDRGDGGPRPGAALRPLQRRPRQLRPFWTIVMVLFFVGVIAASFYLVVTLEILKLRRWRSVAPASASLSPEAVDEGVKRELETGSFEIVNPATGEYEAVDPETGEFEAIDPGAA